MRRFVRTQNFSAVSLRDVLEARDHYAVHLANLPNVVGTAAGRYRSRLKDKRKPEEIVRGGTVNMGAKTLANSRMHEWSWPCVLVFVDEWLPPDVFAKHPERAVPPLLYLPDGRIVRTCVVLVEPRKLNLPTEKILSGASAALGAGTQLFTSAQDRVRLGVATCMVSDGGLAYVLGSGHLMRPAGTIVRAQARGRVLSVGTSARILDEAPLAEAYPGFAGRRMQVTLDAGLLEVNTANEWTSQFAGVASMGAPIDLTSETLTLDLIGCPLFTILPGGIRVDGCVHGLFYRHATMAGIDSATEMLIGPRAQGSVQTRPGDSGVLWFWDHLADDRAEEVELPKADVRQTEFRPIAMQWGGQGFKTAPGLTMEFALASGLTTVCRRLGVEVVRDWDSFSSRYWGKVGHYKVAASACTLLHSSKAKTLFKANLSRIAVDDGSLEAKDLPMKSDDFIPLADVADLYFRGKRKKDDANHFADMDEPAPSGPHKGKTLLQLWKSLPTSRTPAFWTAFYDAIDPRRPDKHRGALPFRIKELYELMVYYVSKGKVAEYTCVAGLLAHYGGDSCQPLHISFLHHGEPDDASDDAVHAAYEDKMLTKFAPEVVAGVNHLAKPVKASELFQGGLEAADAIVQLMQRTVKALPPEEVLECFNETRGRDQLDQMWDQLGEKTLKRLADGAHTLALIWQSAWTEGGGDKAGHIAATKLKAIPEATLRKLYQNRTFAESKWLREMT